MPDRLSPIQVFLSAFTISSVAGLAAYLRSGRPLSWRQTISAMLNSGLLGLAIAFLWYTYFNGKDNVWFLLGVSLLAGLGGISLLDFALQIAKKGGLDIHITTTKQLPPEWNSGSSGQGTEAENDDK